MRTAKNGNTSGRVTVSWENHELAPVPLPSEISVGGAGMSVLSGNIAHAGGSVDQHWSSTCTESDTVGTLNFLLESRTWCGAYSDSV